MVSGSTRDPRPGMVIGMMHGGKRSRPGVVLVVDLELQIVRIVFGTTKPPRQRTCRHVSKNSRDGVQMGLRKATNFCCEEVETRTVDDVRMNADRWGWCPAGLLGELIAFV
jgi:hypothetical protein